MRKALRVAIGGVVFIAWCNVMAAQWADFAGWIVFHGVAWPLDLQMWFESQLAYLYIGGAGAARELLAYAAIDLSELFDLLAPVSAPIVIAWVVWPWWRDRRKRRLSVAELVDAQIAGSDARATEEEKGAPLILP